jgi:hypothetical protein
MYPVTHMTIAVGSVWLGARLWRRIFPERHALGASRPAQAGGASGFDYRFVAFGALVPDLIDKRLSWYLFPGSFPDSHIFGHTLLLSAVLIALGVVLTMERGDVRLLGLGHGSLTHPLVDPVVLSPGTLLWPALGTAFPDVDSFIPVQWVIDLVLIAAYGILYRKRAWFRELAADFIAAGRLPQRLGGPPRPASVASRAAAAAPAMSPDADG